MELRLGLSIMLGCLLGLGVRYLTLRLIQNRASQNIHNLFFDSKWSMSIWIMMGAIGYGMIAFLTNDIIRGIEYMGMYSILLSLTVTDYSIRKIPNVLLLVLLVLKLGSIVARFDYASLLPAFAGLVAGLILFLVPSYIGIGIGWGDVKFAAVAGFCLGILGILQASLVMAVVLVFYLLYLIVTKRG